MQTPLFEAPLPAAICTPECPWIDTVPDPALLLLLLLLPLLMLTSPPSAFLPL
jgi:hypothetical protein